MGQRGDSTSAEFVEEKKEEGVHKEEDAKEVWQSRTPPPHEWVALVEHVVAHVVESSASLSLFQKLNLDLLPQVSRYDRARPPITMDDASLLLY